MDDVVIYKVTRTNIKNKEVRVRWSTNKMMAIQTHVASFFNMPKIYEVKVELFTLQLKGEVDMGAYMARRDMETFVKSQ